MSKAFLDKPLNLFHYFPSSTKIIPKSRKKDIFSSIMTCFLRMTLKFLITKILKELLSFLF